MNFGLIVLDYLLQTKELTGKFDVNAAKNLLKRIETQLNESDYQATLNLIDRIAKAVEEA